MNNLQVGPYLLLQRTNAPVFQCLFSKDGRKIEVPVPLEQLLNNYLSLISAHVQRANDFFRLFIDDPDLFLADIDRQALTDLIPYPVLPVGFDKFSYETRQLFYLEQFVIGYNLFYQCNINANQVAELGGIL